MGEGVCVGLWRALSGIGILIDLHSLSLSLSVSNLHRYSVDQSMHSVYTLCLYGSHCRCCNISPILPNPVQCPSPHSAQYHVIFHRPSTCAWRALFRNIMREKQTKRRRWTVDSGLKTVNSSGGTRKTVIAIVVVVVAAAAVFSLVKFSFYLFSYRVFIALFAARWNKTRQSFE